MTFTILTSLVISVTTFSNDSLFKYISSKDTVIICSNEIVQISKNPDQWEWNYQLSTQKRDELQNAQSDSGMFFLYCPSSKKWIMLQQMRWQDSAIPSWWFVELSRTNKIVDENGVIRLCCIRNYSKKRCPCSYLLSKEDKRRIRKNTKREYRMSFE